MDSHERPRFLTKEQIFGSPLREVVVEVAGWEGNVLVRELTKVQQEWCRQQPDFDSAVFQAGVIEPVFTAEETKLVKGKSAEAFDTVVSAILNIRKPKA